MFASALLLQAMEQIHRRSESGPSRHFTATPDVGRFRTEADMNRLARPAASVANDPHFGHERLDRHSAPGAIKLERLRATWWGTNKTRLGLDVRRLTDHAILPTIFSRPRLDALMVRRPESPAPFAFRLPAPPRRCPYPGRRTVLRQRRIRRLH
jgi:hypothetical protein